MQRMDITQNLGLQQPLNFNVDVLNTELVENKKSIQPTEISIEPVLVNKTSADEQTNQLVPINPNNFNKNHIVFTEEEFKFNRHVQDMIYGVGVPKDFMILSGGLYHVVHITKPDMKPFYSLSRISGYLYIVANIHDTDNDNWGFLVHFTNLAGQGQNAIVRLNSFLGKVPCGQDCVTLLAKRGLRIRNGEKLTDFFKESGTIRTVTEVTQTGWHNKCFGLPGIPIGKNDDAYFNIKASAGFESKNGLASWIENIGKYCEGNKRLIFAVSCAFAAPLLKLCGLEGGGFHFYGQSSCGKTTLLRVATSVCGSPDYMQNWRATSNGLESVAENHNDLLLVLDEIGQADPSAIGDTIYMLANGLGKIRSSSKGAPKSIKKWLNLFLSTGELDLESHMRTAHKTTKNGQEVRCLSIPATSENSKYGIFDNIHDFTNSADFAEYFISKTKKHYGSPLLIFLHFLVEHPIKTQHEFDKYLTEQKVYFGHSLSGLANRALNRFALVGFAGEKATEWGITGWKKGSATDAFRRLFNEWNNNPERMSDLDKLKQQVRLFFEKDPAYKISPYFSEWSLQGREQWVTPERFKTDVIHGLNSSWAVKELIKLGWITPGNAKDRYTQKRRIDKAGIYHGVYVFDITRVFGDDFLDTQTENV